jgi:hypothetical protein
MSIYLTDTVTQLLYAGSLLSWSKEEKRYSDVVLHQLLVSADDFNLRNKNVSSILRTGDTSFEHLQRIKRLSTTVMNPDIRQE